MKTNSRCPVLKIIEKHSWEKQTLVEIERILIILMQIEVNVPLHRQDHRTEAPMRKPQG